MDIFGIIIFLTATKLEFFKCKNKKCSQNVQNKIFKSLKSSKISTYNQYINLNYNGFFFSFIQIILTYGKTFTINWCSFSKHLQYLQFTGVRLHV